MCHVFLLKPVQQQALEAMASIGQKTIQHLRLLVLCEYNFGILYRVAHVELVVEITRLTRDFSEVPSIPVS